MTATTSGGAGFDNERYLAEQSEAILERMHQVGGQLHLDFRAVVITRYEDQPAAARKSQ